MRKYLIWALIAFVAFVYLQALFFKFTGSEETNIIFSTIGAWMAGLPVVSALAGVFSKYGGYAVGAVELLATILIIVPGTRAIGAVLSLVVISGAIFFHLFTPLGVDRIIDAAGNTDGGALFFMACGVWICSLAILLLNRSAKQNRG